MQPEAGKRVVIDMIQRSAFYVFRVCLLACASMVLIALWSHLENQLWFQSTATLFVVGLAAFLIWFSSVLLRPGQRAQEAVTH